MPQINMTEDERRAMISALEEAIDNEALPALVTLYHRVLDARPGDDDCVQFARLLSKVHIGDRHFTRLKESTGLDGERINEILARARRVWEVTRQPVDLGEQIAAYFKQGLSTDDILEKLDPDTAGVDLIDLVKKLMSEITIRCKFCAREIDDPEVAHFHQGQPVCD